MITRRGIKSKLQVSFLKKKNQLALFFVVFVAIFSFVGSEVLAIPNLINYQGRLRDNTGTPIIVSTTIQFSVYNHLTSGAPGDAPGSSGPLLWKEVYDGSSGDCPKVQPDAQGYFTVNLGSCTTFPSYLDFSSGTYYLAVKIESDSEASPRVILATHPYAFNSERVDGFHATSTATANQLLALDNDDNFNLSDGSYLGGAFTMNSSTATSTIAGNLSVTKNAIFNTTTISQLTVSGVSSLGVISAGTWQGDIIATNYGGTGTSTIGSSGSIAFSNGTSYAFTSVGSSGQLLMSNGAGIPTWTSTNTLGFIDTTTSPAGSLNQIQFNNSGVFGATSTFVWDNLNGLLGIGTSTPSSSLHIQSGKNSVLKITNDNGVDLLEATNYSARFGLGVEAGAFMSRNSYIGEEFTAYRSTRNNAVDYAGNGTNSFGDSRNWGVYSSANDCTYGMVSDGANGRIRLTANTTNRGCLIMMDETTRVPRRIVGVNYLPTMMMKVGVTNVGANNVLFVGLATTTDGQTTDPATFVGFTNNSGTTWTGRTTLGGVSTNVTCTGQTISTTVLALLKVEVRGSSDVRFFVDNNVSDGISFFECGSSATNIPTTLLAPQATYQVRTGGTAGTFMDVDFFRIWQDDEMSGGTVTITTNTYAFDEVIQFNSEEHQISLSDGINDWELIVAGTSSLSKSIISELSILNSIIISSATPATTNNALYSQNDLLYWNGNEVGSSSTISGLTVDNFATNTISQWINDSGYITSFTETDPVFMAASSSFMLVGTDNWVNITGDIMSGALTINDSLAVTGTSTLTTTSITNLRIGDDFGFPTDAPVLVSYKQYTDLAGFEFLPAHALLTDLNPTTDSSSTLSVLISLTTNENSTTNFDLIGANFNQAIHNGSGEAEALVGSYSTAELASATGSVNMAAGIAGQVMNGVQNSSHSGSIGTAIGVFAMIENGMGGGSIGSAAGVMTDFMINGGTIGDAYGMRINNPTSDSASGTIGNLYGLYIAEQNFATTSNFNIYSDGANSINYFGGKVGIGTTTPNYNLHVVHDENYNGPLVTFENINNGASSTELMQFKVGNYGGGIGVAGENFSDYGLTNLAGYTALISGFPGASGNGLALLAGASGNIIFYAGGFGPPTMDTERMRIENDGRVAIGTSSIYELLTVAGGINIGATTTPTSTAGTIAFDGSDFIGYTGSSWLSLTSGIGSITGAGSIGQISFWDSTSSITGTTSLFWDSTNGYLGIGTSTPSSILDIVEENEMWTMAQLHNLNTGPSSTAFLTVRVGENWGGGLFQASPNYSDFDMSHLAGYTVLLSGGPDLQSNGLALAATEDNNILFFAGGGGPPTADNERMRIESDGRVAIGTSSIYELLTVAGGINIGATTTPTSTAGTIAFDGSDFIGYTGSSWLSLTSGIGSITGAGSIGQISFWDSTSSITGTTSLFWDSTNGYLGIGTNTPSASLTVNGSSSLATTSILTRMSIGQTPSFLGNNLLQINSSNNIPTAAFSSSIFEIDSEDGLKSDFVYRLSADTNAYHPATVYTRSRGTLATPTIVSNGTIVGGNYFMGYDSNSWEESASIRATIDGSPGNGDMPGRLSFFTTPDGSASGVERITIKNNGRVGIGTTSPSSFLTVVDNSGSVTPFYLQANVNNYAQFNIRNINSGANASTDFVATADTGTETTNYVNLGINNSGYSNPSFGSGPYDGYLYTSDGNLWLGTATTTASKSNIIFHTGGTVASKERMRIDMNGNIGIGTTSPVSVLDVYGNLSITGANRYLNFGSVTSSDGYGVRDNAGVMQWKNQSGDWNNFSTKINHIINVAKSGGDFDNLEEAVAFANSVDYDTIINIYPGVYEVSSTLLVTSTHLKGISGINREAVIIRPTTDLVSSPGPVFEIDFPEENDFSIRLLTIDGSQTAGFQTTADCDAIRISNTGSVWMDFSDLVIIETETGIDMQVANLLNIFKTDFYRIGDIGVNLDNGASAQVENVYMEDVENRYVHLKSTAGSSSFYMVGSEFGSLSDLGTGLYIEGDGSYAEIRYSNMWGLDYNIVTNDNSRTKVTASYLQKAANLNIEQKDSSTINISSSDGAFSSADISINNSANVYFYALAEEEGTVLFGRHADVNQDLIKIDTGDAILPKFAYRSNYYGNRGLIFIDENTDSKTFLGVQSASSSAKISAISGDRNELSGLYLYSDTDDFGTTSSMRGWLIGKYGENSNLIFGFNNSDSGDSKSLIDNKLMTLDGFNSQMLFNGGAVFNTSSGIYDFQVKGDNDTHALFVQGSSDNVGIGTSTPSHKLTVQGDVNITGSFMMNGTPLTAVDLGTITGQMAYWDGDSWAPTSNIFVSSSGFIGIGTTTPKNALTLVGGLSICSSTPDVTAYTLYNLGGQLYWNGSPVIGGSTSTYIQDSDGDTKVETEESPDQDQIHFYTADEQRMIITDDGRVGIGTSTPGLADPLAHYLVDIEMTSNTNSGIRLANLSAGNGASTEIDFYNDSGQGGVMFLAGSNFDGFPSAVGAFGLAATAGNDLVLTTLGGNIRFATLNQLAAGSSSVYVAGSGTNEGYVGINTSSPLSELSVNGNIFIEGENRYINFGTTTGALGYGFRENNGIMELRNINNNHNIWSEIVINDALIEGNIIYVNAESGKDTFDGNSPARAKKTIQAAIDTAAALSSSTNPYTVSVSAGTFTEDLDMKDFVVVKGAGCNTFIKGKVTFDMTYGSVLSMVDVENTDDYAVEIKSAGRSVLKNVEVGAEYTDGSKDIQAVVYQENGTLESFTANKYNFTQTTSTAGTKINTIFYFASSTIVSAYVYNPEIYVNTYDDDDELSMVYTENQSFRSVATIKDAVVIFPIYASSPANVVKMINHENARFNTYVDAAFTTVLTVAPGSVKLIPAYVNNSTVLSGAQITNSSFAWSGPGVSENDVYLSSANTANDQVILTSNQYKTTSDIFPVRYETDGASGTLEYFVSNGYGDLQNSSFTTYEGSFGIGTSTPYDLLEVWGADLSSSPTSSRNYITIVANGNGEAGNYVRRVNSGAYDNGWSWYMPTSSLDFRLWDDSLGAEGDDMLTIQAGTGFVGIGQALYDPLNKLHVEGGIYLASTTVATTSNSVYNVGGDLYWNGNLLATAGGATANWLLASHNGGDALTTSTTIPVWFKDVIYASSSVYIDGTLNVLGAVNMPTTTITELTVNNINVLGTVSTTDILVADSITLGGVTRNTWPTGGGGESVWATTSLNVAYPDLSGDYAIVIGNSVTSSDVKFEVDGDTKLGGNLSVTGNNIYFNNGITNYLNYNNSDLLFELSNQLNVLGLVSSTALQVNGDVTTTGKMVIGGPVGIGTTTPQAPLHVVTDSSGPAMTILQKTVVGATNLNFVTQNNKYWQLSKRDAIQDDKFIFYFVDDADSFTNVLTLNSTGTVGINNENPNAMLTITGTSTYPLLNIMASSSATGLYVSNIGNVGIGTTDPNYYKLRVYAEDSDVSAEIKTASSSKVALFNLKAGDDTNVLQLGYYGSTTPGFAGVLPGSAVWDSVAPGGSYFINESTSTNAALVFMTNGWQTTNERMRITNGGYVGIGTSTPLSRLSLAEGDFRLSSGTAAWVMGPGAFPGRSVNTDPIGLNFTNSSTWNSGLFTEVDYKILSYGINVSQLGTRDTSTIGAIFRLDTRINTPYWSIKRQAVGGDTEFADMQISTAGDVGFGGHANDTNVFGGQVHILSRASTTVGLLVQGATGQTANLQNWVDATGNTSSFSNIGWLGIGTSTPTAVLSIAMNTTSVINITNNNTGYILLEGKYLSQNFGMSIEAGAFITRNAYFREEFSRERGQIAADTLYGWGDFQGFAIEENGACNWNTVNDAVNGIGQQTGTAGSYCLAYYANTIATDAHLVFDADNLPVFLMKTYPSTDSANARFWIGAGDMVAAQTTDPTNGIYFTNNTATGDWRGVTRRAGASTNVECTGQTVNNTVFATTKIEVVSSNGDGTGAVKFYIDNDTTDGINWTYCGESTTNIPTVGLTAMLMNYSTAAQSLYVDYYRVWQDDSTETPIEQIAEELPEYIEKNVFGVAQIKAGDTSVQISFDGEYAVPPMMGVTPLNFGGLWKLQAVTTTGFTISLVETALEDILFNWQAYMVEEDTQIYSSDGSVQLLKDFYLDFNSTVNIPPVESSGESTPSAPIAPPLTEQSSGDGETPPAEVPTEPAVETPSVETPTEPTAETPTTEDPVPGPETSTEEPIVETPSAETSPAPEAPAEEPPAEEPVSTPEVSVVETPPAEVPAGE